MRQKFKSELAAAGLSQRDLARLLGKDATTVNRWCSTRADALPAPQYARRFVSAWRLLSGHGRALLLGAAD